MGHLGFKMAENQLFAHPKFCRNNLGKKHVTPANFTSMRAQCITSWCQWGIAGCGWCGNRLLVLPFIMNYHHKGAQGSVNSAQ